MPVKSEKQRRFFQSIVSGDRKNKKSSGGGIGPSKEVAQKFLDHKSGRGKK